MKKAIGKHKKLKLLKMGNFTFFFFTMLSMQSVSKVPLIATFQFASVASLKLGRSQNGVFGNGLSLHQSQVFTAHLMTLRR